MIRYIKFQFHTRWYDEETGFVHRLEGAAMEFEDGRKEWYYQGRKINCSNQKEFEQLLKVKAFWE